MPELPDIVTYLCALETRVLGHRLLRLRLKSPFLLRSADPPISDVENRTVVELRRLGKRIVIGLDGDLFIVIHLMIAGRLHWRDGPDAKMPVIAAGALNFDNGTLLLTEAGTRKRMSLYVTLGKIGLAEHHPGGLEVLEADFGAFQAALRRESHTLKRALTDPHLFSGIGNAYSDEILHRARLSPFRLTGQLDEAEIQKLLSACQSVLNEWTEKLKRESAGRFPERVTAFREDMAVHGRYGLPCPVCKVPVQRIVYADNEANYCPGCQTDGRLLADRALSRLLKQDWPRTLDELEAHRTARREAHP